ncbi:16S rRNA (guanine(527)-N(7))-methyltransferase RsmG [Salidesulfovibrio brasiliensis]|uniref:16S rRNA (guanine(527)-N(7))-methyltransferase RsmG n=1 Tax=Salidesulfovibrio brasiliensis TaxID=221711 RepID=UPI0006D278CB
MAGPDASAVTGEARKLGFSLDAPAAEALAAYLGLLERWNRRTNLVGRKGWRDVLRHLAADSLHLAGFLDELDLPDSPLTLDLGAGAGLPGLPLRTLWQEGEYILVEVREKRAGFMRSALARMTLPRTTVFQGRAEDVLAERSPDRKADIILGRAFMPWRELLDFVRPMLSEQGVVLILSNDPVPSDMPSGWIALKSRLYKVSGAERHFWVLSPHR